MSVAHGRCHINAAIEVSPPGACRVLEFIALDGLIDRLATGTSRPL
ncbi:MAG: hypothetical protein ABI818_16695 [Acidobacteriota bacterium]